MTKEQYAELLQAIGAHDAAMLVKWLLAPPAKGYLQVSVAPKAHKQGLFTTRALTREGLTFAARHMQEYLHERAKTEATDE